MLFASLIAMRTTGAIERSRPRPTPHIMAPREPAADEPDRVAITGSRMLVSEVGF